MVRIMLGVHRESLEEFQGTLVTKAFLENALRSRTFCYSAWNFKLTWAKSSLGPKSMRLSINKSAYP